MRAEYRRHLLPAMIYGGGAAVLGRMGHAVNTKDPSWVAGAIWAIAAIFAALCLTEIRRAGGKR